MRWFAVFVVRVPSIWIADVDAFQEGVGIIPISEFMTLVPLPNGR